MKELVKQHNAITEARYEMSALEKNIIYMLLSLLDEADPPGKTYKIALNDLKGARDKEIGHVYFSKAIKKFVNRRIYTQYGNDKELVLNILSAGRYNQGVIELEISEEMRAFLFALKNNFTLFSLRVALNLKSKYSKRIYEMASQFKDTGEWFITVDELKERLSLFDKKKGKEKYPTYGLFRTKVLEVAQKELAEQADITFTYEAKKTGKKYTHLSFKIKYDKPPKKKSQVPIQNDSSKHREHSNPDLKGDALNQYLYMTKEKRWLDKAMAYKVVKTLSTQYLWDCIGKCDMMIKKGGDDVISPRDFFNQKLNGFLTNPNIQPTWSLCYNKMFVDFRLSNDAIERLKGTLETKTNPVDLLDFLGRISAEIKQKNISKIQKRNYVKERLTEEFSLTI